MSGAADAEVIGHEVATPSNLLLVLERIAAALEKSNELAERQVEALDGIGDAAYRLKEA